MNYEVAAADAPLDQGDLIDGCPINLVRSYAPDLSTSPVVDFAFPRVMVLTQTCDLANQKSSFVNVAEVFDAQALIDEHLFKPADLKGPLRAGRIWGWYFLPADTRCGLGEMVIDLRRLHTVRIALLLDLCLHGKRRGRLPTRRSC